MKRYCVQIIERASKREILNTTIEASGIQLARIQAYKDAQSIGYGDLLKYEIWIGTPEAFKQYREGMFLK